VLKTALDTR